MIKHNKTNISGEIYTCHTYMLHSYKIIKFKYLKDFENIVHWFTCTYTPELFKIISFKAMAIGQIQIKIWCV